MLNKINECPRMPKASFPALLSPVNAKERRPLLLMQGKLMEKKSHFETVTLKQSKNNDLRSE